MNGSRIPLDEIKRHPHGQIFDAEHAGPAFAPKPEHGFVAPADRANLDRLDVGNPDMLAELAGIRAERVASGAKGATTHDGTSNATVAARATESRPVARPFQLISRRLPNVYNSSGRDIEALQRGKTWNPAFLHPDDLVMLGLADGDLVEITSDHDSILGVVESASELRRGIVSMAHCYGDGPDEDGEQGEKDERVRALGSSTGRLVDNLRDFDPHTGIPRMSAIDVSLRRHEPSTR